MKRLIKKEYNQETKTLYQTNKIKDHFGLKDKTPKEIRSRVVYKFVYSSDSNIAYIGYTNRAIKERVNEHFGGAASAINGHIASCRTCEEKASLENFTILKQCRDKYDTIVHEALFIQKENPILNRQLVKQGYTFTLRVFD